MTSFLIKCFDFSYSLGRSSEKSNLWHNRSWRTRDRGMAGVWCRNTAHVWRYI